jgi:hypothetical protein
LTIDQREFLLFWSKAFCSGVAGEADHFSVSGTLQYPTGLGWESKLSLPLDNKVGSVELRLWVVLDTYRCAGKRQALSWIEIEKDLTLFGVETFWQSKELISWC